MASWILLDNKRINIESVRAYWGMKYNSDSSAKEIGTPDDPNLSPNTDNSWNLIIEYANGHIERFSSKIYTKAQIILYLSRLDGLSLPRDLSSIK